MSATSSVFQPRPVHVLAIGGVHQLGHILPVACELERRHSGCVRLFVSTDAEAQAARQQAGGEPLPEVVVMDLPAGAALLPKGMHKSARLIAWAGRVRSAAVILCAERTSTLLKRLSGACPPILHIPHGAGDRAVGFEDRFRLFEHVMVAGHKDRDRLVDSGVVPPEKCTVTGPIKLSTVLARAAERPPLFRNERRTILYNPHFSSAHSSIHAFGEKLVDAVVADGRYNLIVAPHVRLARTWSAARRRHWQSLAVPGQVEVDLGSMRCNDMSYTLGADLYVGDVSSQVYEFLVYPRPCLFVDAHAVAWRNSEDYAMWHFGDVVTPQEDPIAAIDRAFACHAAYVGWQRERMASAMEGLSWLPGGAPTFQHAKPVQAAADVVERFAGLGTPAMSAAA
ncbi:glycosyl transferase [Novosphingobium panipatense]|jgi:hypothetical protein|uniref:glycosyl transferase n=1 Tax=Novosphingobium TaxID=165696 RepID=UPI000CDB52A5|nr:glycosyl transferase [Novosphingobium sp. HII-3]